uniref:Uncharacterized protein n=1 Tax=viral metagenome TaxID=1070528 RepID=A0A6H1ZL81_9ZZZZ
MSALEGAQRCLAKKSDGSSCQNLAVKGLQVCRWHGDKKTLSRDLVSPDILKPGILRHLKKLEESLDAYDEIAHIRAWRDYVEEYISKASKGKPSAEQVKILVEANKEARAAIEAQTRIEYNKANLITQRDAASFVAEIISIARQTVRNNADLVRFLNEANNYFSVDKVSMGKERDNGSNIPSEN